MWSKYEISMYRIILCALDVVGGVEDDWHATPNKIKTIILGVIAPIFTASIS